MLKAILNIFMVDRYSSQRALQHLIPGQGSRQLVGGDGHLVYGNHSSGGCGGGGSGGMALAVNLASVQRCSNMSSSSSTTSSTTSGSCGSTGKQHCFRIEVDSVFRKNTLSLFFQCQTSLPYQLLLPGPPLVCQGSRHPSSGQRNNSQRHHL